MRQQHDGRGTLRLANGASWDGHYMINVMTDLARATRSAHGLFTPKAPVEPIFLVAHGDTSQAWLMLEDGREVETTVMFNGAASVDMISFEENPFPG